MEKKVLSVGAEAIIELREENGKKIVLKRRIPKKYRIEELDVKIRRQRNKEEAKILEKLENIISVPKLIKQEEFEITMDFVEGESLKAVLEEMENSKVCETKLITQLAEKIGETLVKMHEKNVVHGDLAPSNFIISKDYKTITLIDFGLGYFSSSIEDFAMDLFVMEETFKIFGHSGKNLFNAASEFYFSNFKKGKDVEKRLEKIRKRRRYV